MTTDRIPTTACAECAMYIGIGDETPPPHDHPDGGSTPTMEAGRWLLDALRDHAPWFVGGSADAELAAILAIEAEARASLPKPLPNPTDLPDRIVVGANGAYWRDYGSHYSMPPVSEDNDPVEVVATYIRAEPLTRSQLREAYTLGWRDHEAGIASRPPAEARAEPRAEGLREALAVAKDIIDANPAEDQCRHGSYVYECDEPDGCADRSRREQIDAALDLLREPS